jgi:sugar/nucleoside kinase (ribokinase family)
MASPAALISTIILGPLRSEYHILPNRTVCSGILGGPAAYAATGYRIWSPDPVGIVARVGDSFPTDWLNRLSGHGFRTDGIRRLAEPQPWIGFRAYENWRLHSETEPHRWFAALGLPEPIPLRGFQSPTAGEELKNAPPEIAIRPDDVPREFFQARAAFLAPAHLFSQFLLSVTLRNRGIGSLMLAPSERILRPEMARELSALLHGMDIFFARDISAFHAWPEYRHRAEAVAEGIAKLGPRLVLLHRGLEGVHLFDAEAQRHIKIPPYPVTPVDISAMEDSFCGGFLAGWLATFDPIESALRGIISSSLAIEGSGAWFALERLPGLAETRLVSLRDSFHRLSP